VPVTVLVRDRATARNAEADGARAVIGDLANVASLVPAMQGIQTMFLASAAHPDQTRWHHNAIEAASNAGVRHIVKLSAGRASGESIAAIKRWHWETEQEIAESGIGYTHLRPNGFMQNFLRFRSRIISEGAFSAPVGDARVSVIDAEDIADVATAVLLEPSLHHARVYELTGGEARTYGEAAGIIAAACGHDVVFEDETREEFCRRAIARGEPEWFVPFLVEIFDFIRAGAAADVTNDVGEVTGRRARSLERFAEAHGHLFARRLERPVTAGYVDGGAA
jgi:uncharacterized protein YbjT (DUF2867 family)